LNYPCEEIWLRARYGQAKKRESFGGLRVIFGNIADDFGEVV